MIASYILAGIFGFVCGGMFLHMGYVRAARLNGAITVGGKVYLFKEIVTKLP
jgi:hypothetical protein